MTRPAARPLPAAADVTLHSASFAELHSASAVKSLVAPSEYVPVARSWRVVPSAIVGFVGVTASESRVTGLLLEPWCPGQAPMPMASARATRERETEILCVRERAMGCRRSRGRGRLRTLPFGIRAG